MKASIITFLSLTSLASAQDTQWYTLKTKADVNTLSNLYLAPRGGKVAAFPGARESSAVAGKFSSEPYAGGTLSLFPGSDRSHQIGLSGKNGLLNLVDLTAPSAEKIDPDTPTEWSVFTIGQGGEVGVKDGRTVPGRWVAYLETDGVYYVGFWDGATKQPRTIANVTIIAEKTTPGA